MFSPNNKPYTSDVVKRFWDKVVSAETNDECWRWIATTSSDGYGQLFIGGKMVYAHRIAWELFYGDIPKDSQVLHHCDNPRCVNPSHLFLGDSLVNNHDKMKKGRAAKKLSPENIAEIRELLRQGEPQVVIAKRYSISHTTVSCIKNGKLWQWVT